MNNDSFDNDLAIQVAELNKEKQPERDLWQGIDLALANEEADFGSQTKTNRNKYLIAASVAMFGLLGGLSIYQQQVNLTGSDLVASLSQQHLQQKNELLVSYKEQTPLTENWQQQLKDLDLAADAIKTALENDPNNMPLLKMLQNVHQQQISLIERVHAPKWSQI
ncbi:hypothetical protein [Paraglaciecola sp.]|uniref:hypothetical protein n=1 Tax=Paraglaciecola sp. TaxID=1920173 RepID=UPI003EF0ABED